MINSFSTFLNTLGALKKSDSSQDDPVALMDSVYAQISAGSKSVPEIVDSLKISPSIVTKTLDAMVQNGLIQIVDEQGRKIVKKS